MMSRKKQYGFTLLETMISTVIFLVIASIVMSGMIQLLRAQGTIANRTEMHTSVRSATELLQQEIGQAGRISLPNTGAVGTGVTMTGPLVANAVQTPAVSSTAGMFVGMLLDVDTGVNFEVVQLTGVTSSTITANFQNAHGASIPVMASGSFGTGIIPPAAAPASYLNGSTGTVLKLYGDINRDGNVLYVEYTCAPGTIGNPGYLYRNEMPAFTTVLKPPVSPSMYLLTNVLQNPSNAPCFTYQVQLANGQYFVTDVAVTLTVQTPNKDPQTNIYQQETKALLNISPRNVFYVWELESINEVPRNQPIPLNVTALLQ
ncbi:MAG TPA: prepilin-type N-terminal cleavage/methylation domain-containing protein [Candidatus Acidoferrum sp.]|jgi:prepilin-type N-terminal cleavage/methylation domain-containing protein